MFRSSRLAIAGFVLLVSSLCAARNPDGTFQRTLQVTGPVDLTVFTHSGDIVVHSGPAGTVSISGKIFVGDHWRNNGRKQERRCRGPGEGPAHPPIGKQRSHRVSRGAQYRD